jgi:hypothetical protein
MRLHGLRFDGIAQDLDESSEEVLAPFVRMLQFGLEPLLAPLDGAPPGTSLPAITKVPSPTPEPFCPPPPLPAYAWVSASVRPQRCRETLHSSILGLGRSC